MTRVLASLVLAATLAIGGSFAFDAISGPAPAAAAKKSVKVCRSRTPSGKIKTWRCGTDQACCVNHDLGIYVCGFPGLGCL